MMGKLNTVLAICLLVGTIKANGNDENLSESQNAAELSQSVSILPIISNQTESIPQINGRLLTPAEGCGFSPIGSTNRIVGGGPARNGAWPWAALLGYRSFHAPVGYTFNCGGSLITSRHVLSAAHCMNNHLWFARLGEHDTRTSSEGKHEDIEIFKRTPHPRFDPVPFTNNIAILHLLHDVTFTDRIRPVCLPAFPHMQNKILVGLNPFSIGWGHTEQGQSSPYLKQVLSKNNLTNESAVYFTNFDVQMLFPIVPVVSNKACRDAYRVAGLLRTKVINEMNICAGLKQGHSSCQGDSGVPLLLPIPENDKFAYLQIGVAEYFIDWIVDSISSGTFG